MNKYIYLIVFITILFIYLFFAGRFKFYFPKTNRDYFTRLSYSFLQGKLDVPDPGYTPNDLSYYHGKYYLYWGPVPAILLLPITYFLGTNISDIFYTSLFGSINVLLMYLLFLEFQKFNKLALSKNIIMLITLFFAFGTIHFYLSVLGTVWFTSQILTLTTYIFSLFFLFKHLNKRNSVCAVLSIFFLGASTLGKYTFLLSFPLHFGLLYKYSRLSYLNIVKLIMGFLVFIVMTLIYNYFRFGSAFNNGLIYMQVNSRFLPDLRHFGYFNVYYIFKNVYYLFLNPLQFMTQKPFILPDPNGNSIFFTTPIFILLLLSSFKKYFQTRKQMFRYLGITVIFMLLPVLLYYGGGWYQWGYRYALDVYPLLFLLLLMIINKYSSKVIYTLGILSILINLYGTLWMMEFAKHSYF